MFCLQWRYAGVEEAAPHARPALNTAYWYTRSVFNANLALFWNVRERLLESGKIKQCTFRIIQWDTVLYRGILMRIAHYIADDLERNKAFIAYIALCKKGKRSRAGRLHTRSALFHRRGGKRQ